MTQKVTMRRRRFLTATGAAVAAPLIHVPAAGRPAASDRLAVGVIGTGKRGHTLMRGLSRFAEVEFVAVSDVEANRRASGRDLANSHNAKHGGKTGGKGVVEYLDFRALLAHEGLDAVVIATPDHWHALPILAAARAGKHIFCEKPLTLTIREAQLVAEVVENSGVTFQTGSQQRSECGGRFHRACELIRNGRLGKISRVNVGVGGPSRPCDLPEQEEPADAEWNLWLGPAPRRGYNEKLCPKGVHGHYPAWRDYQEYSGGGMTDWGAHHFDIAQWGLGMDDSGPVEIHPPDGKEFKTLTYHYANGVVMQHGGADGVKFFGEKGWIEVNRGHLRASDEAILKEEIGAGETRLYKAHHHLGNWVECIRDKKPAICTAEIGARTVTICHLGNLALWNKRSLKWDPQKWEFVGDDEANGWRDREMRGPWKLG